MSTETGNANCSMYRFEMENPLPSIPTSILAPYQLEFWRPSLLSLRPRGLKSKAYLAWPLFHYLGIFATSNFSVLTIRDNSRLVHYSGVFPGFFRFPFMAKHDLQIGATWTDPDYRGKGLAVAAIVQILKEVKESAQNIRRIWYITEGRNRSSVRVVEKAGFHLVGSCRRTSRLGLRILGAFVPIPTAQDTPLSIAEG